MKRFRRIAVAVGLAVVLATVAAQTVHADGFLNCQTLWWYTQCYWVDLDRLTADQNSFGFEAMYALCQALGLCP